MNGSKRLWQAVIVLGVLLALMALGLVGTAGTVLLRTEATYDMDTDTLWWTPVAVSRIDAFDLKLE